MNQWEKAAYFRQLHNERPLILPNAWDAASACVIEAAGAKAIATGSAGVAWANGYPGGQRIGREAMLAAIRAIPNVQPKNCRQRDPTARWKVIYHWEKLTHFLPPAKDKSMLHLLLLSSCHLVEPTQSVGIKSRRSWHKS